MSAQRQPEKTIDITAALDRVGGDEELLKEIAVLFLGEYPDLLQKIRDGLDRGDSSAVERFSHSLKGAVANFSAQSAFSAAFELESLGRAGNLGNAESAWRNLDQAFAALRPALEHLAR
jgi:HPt (histidine-containing phosphotransfer) domain-containing protein